MVSKTGNVRVYVFSKLDKEDNLGKSGKAQKRLVACVREYCRACGLELVRPEFLGVERTSKGKPYFPQYPQIHFSVSHSGDYWACAVSLESVGMDLQKHVLLKHETREEASARFQKMARRFLHPTEAYFVEQNPYDRFFTVWTAKEAYVKYTGQGIDKCFSELLVIPEKEVAWPPLEEPVAKWQALGVWFHKQECEDQYSLCICSKENMECVMVDCKTQRTMIEKDL